MVASDIIFASHASEGGHWYDKDANLVELVPNAKGDKHVKPDIRHARKLDLAPGVTTIIRCAAAPGLVRWQVQQGIQCALTLTRNPDENDSQFLSRVEADSKEQAKQAAEEGTRIHAAIQTALQGQPWDITYDTHVTGVLSAIEVMTGETAWRSEIAVASPFGYGTKVDLAGNGWIIDFKSKDGDEEKLRNEALYDEHFMQLAAGAKALGMYDAKGAIVFVSRTHPGVAVAASASAKDMDRGWQLFRSLLRYWQWKQNPFYRPTWATEEA